jgi:hypothetical protein
MKVNLSGSLGSEEALAELLARSNFLTAWHRHGPLRPSPYARGSRPKDETQLPLPLIDEAVSHGR